MLRLLVSIVVIAMVSASEKDRCQGPPRIGKCRAHTVRWFYNAISATCQPFVYGGCRSNGNNFVTQRDCDETCANSIIRGPGVSCKQFTCALLCEHGFKTSETGCLVCECAELTGCPAIQCALHCDRGFTRDDRGCEQCECYGVSRCPNVSCNVPCPYGFKWERGCQTCECNRHKCETLHCRDNEVCSEEGSMIRGSRLCTSTARCVPATDLDQQFGRQEINFVIHIKHSKNDGIVDVGRLKWYIRWRLMAWLRLHANCIEHLHVRAVQPVAVRIRFTVAEDKDCRLRNVAPRLRAFMDTFGNVKNRGVIFEVDPRSMHIVTYLDSWLPRRVCFVACCIVFVISFVLLIPMLIISYKRRQVPTTRRDRKSSMVSYVNFPDFAQR